MWNSFISYHRVFVYPSYFELTMAVFTLEKGYLSETGDPLENFRQTGNTS